MQILKKVVKSKECSANQTISHLEFMLEKGFDPGLELVTSYTSKICQPLSWFQVKRWEQGMRIAKDSFQDFLIYVDAVSSIIFIMKMNAIWILTTKLKRNYQIFIQGRLITWEGIVKKFSSFSRLSGKIPYKVHTIQKHDCATKFKF